jgi:hypothetical protein
MAAAGTWPVCGYFPASSPALVSSRSPSSVGRVPQSCKGTWGGCLRVMQVPAHSITTRRLPRVCVGKGGGNPSPGRVRRLPVVVLPPPLESGPMGRTCEHKAEHAGPPTAESLPERCKPEPWPPPSCRHPLSPHPRPLAVTSHLTSSPRPHTTRYPNTRCSVDSFWM